MKGYSRRGSAPVRRPNCHSTLVAWTRWGVFFEDFIVTRDFSECGGSFATTYPIEVGSTLKLADSTGFLSLIRIAWSRQSGKNSQNYGF
ncbi:MAG: hypothetical protein EXQ58_12000 [Acidobacteria bacterium]|nr:hypothetical protein [Acidobacteriota bacterium]